MTKQRKQAQYIVQQKNEDGEFRDAAQISSPKDANKAIVALDPESDTMFRVVRIVGQEMLFSKAMTSTLKPQ